MLRSHTTSFISQKFAKRVTEVQLESTLTYYLSLQLQQYRKKKDGKGSKSLGKAGISEQAVDDDTTPVAVKPAEVKPLVPEGERPAHDLMGEPVNLSVLHSRKNSVASDIDPVTSDSSSVPVLAETDIAQATLPTAVEFPSEVGGVDEVGLSSSVGNEQDVDSSVQNNAGSSCAGDTDAANESSSEKWEMVDSEGKSPHVSEPSPFDLSAPPDLVYASAAVEDAIEVERAHGADQVPDIGCPRILLFSTLLLFTLSSHLLSSLPSPTQLIRSAK